MTRHPDPKQAPSDAWIDALRRRFPTERTVDETLTRKLRRRAGPAHRSQSVAAVIDRLTAFIRKRVAGAFEITDVCSLAGGSSKEQFSFRLVRHAADGTKSEQRLVLRMRPSESIVETHCLREFQAMVAVKDVMPVPAAHWCDSNGDELGQPAMITSFCEGVTRPPSDGAYTPRQGFGAKYRRLLGPQFVRHFAALGAFDWRKADLSAFDVPPQGTNAGVITQLNWWQRVWEEDCLEAYPLMSLAAQWLRDNTPPIDHISLVHRDFRGGNFLFRPEDGVITAILDWELVCLGDRHEDLAFFMSPLFTEKDDDGNALVGGFFSRQEFLSEYARLSGLPVDPMRLAYYNVFSCWRGVINALATAPRIMLGEKTHQDIRVGWIINAAPLMLAATRSALAEVLEKGI